MHGAMKGSYHDTLAGWRGVSVFDSGWRPNMVVQDSNLLLASLMKREVGVTGILYWAIGEGESGWDTAIPSPQPTDTGLANEIARQAVDTSQIVFIDEDDQPSAAPTNRLEIFVQFNGGDIVESGFQSLREFALFGGNADETASSGFMVNRVIHPRIDMAPGMTLERRLRLTFGVSGTAIAEDEAAPPGLESGLPLMGPRASLPVISIDGVGDLYSGELASLGLTTLGDLAEFDPINGAGEIPLVKLREFHAKCRMAMSLRLGFFPIQLVAERNVSDLLRETPESLMQQLNTSGVDQNAVIQLQAELDKLQVALDDSMLQTITIGDLVSTTA